MAGASRSHPHACLHNPPPTATRHTCNPCCHLSAPATPLTHKTKKKTRNCKHLHYTSARVPHLHYKMPTRKVQFVVHVARSDLLRRGLTARDRCKCIRPTCPNQYRASPLCIACIPEPRANMPSELAHKI